MSPSHTLTVSGSTVAAPTRSALEALARAARRDAEMRDLSMKAHSAGVDYWVTPSGRLKPEARW